ncbi:TatD family hydrolase [Candidatus Woesearchaeota archaeon]|jgi:TatD DNase family protein|nr:TatD family hydrolase [Candidatus Woesearchaeota archaeon]MBT4322213.1 TatD family hydrolase [Candidatus Woesearchaeota archaeon]MBT4631233.1 TatD family hydrolase [Candidatus Woesearchaeota archaeon]
MLIDVHCHLDYKDFDKDRDEVIENAKKNNVKIIISNGTDLESNKKVLELSKKYDIIKPAFGLYPVEAENLSEEEIDETLNFIKKNNPVAIGEVGLDLYNGKDIEKQKKVLVKLIDLSKELDIPLIIHSRKAEEEVIELLKETKPKKVILHCFCGNKELTKEAESLGYVFSIPATIIRTKTFKKLAKRIQLKSILTETDAPFLSPYEGKRNEPAYIKETIKKISEIKGLTEEELEKIIFMNYQNLFKK